MAILNIWKTKTKIRNNLRTSWKTNLIFFNWFNLIALLMSSYQYRCSDESILLPFLKKNVFSVLHRYIPYGVPANYLTLVSIFVIWSCFLYFIGIETADEGDIIIAFFAIIIYVIFDHFDGLQAKITATGSPLGEILDHYSDVFNGSIILYLFFRIL